MGHGYKELKQSINQHDIWESKETLITLDSEEKSWSYEHFFSYY